MNRICELVHSLDSDSAARRLAIPALLEVDLAGEATKSGVEPAEIAGYLERYPLIRGLMTMPPLSADPEASRPYFRRLRELASEHGLAELSMGTSQDYRVAVEEGARSCASGRASSDRGARRASRARIGRSWASPTSGTGRSSTSASPRRRSGTRTAT